MKLNKNYEFKKNYVFTEVSEKVAKFKQQNKDIKVYNLGIGDVTREMDKKLVEVMVKSLQRQENPKTFLGYPPETGYDFLKQAIKKNYNDMNINIDTDEIFVSNGAGCDVTNILSLFDEQTAVIADPTYPAYFDSNFLVGNKIILLPLNKENNYKMSPSALKKDKSYLIYICSPNNPTGATLSKEELKQWVDFANQTKSIILFDNAYQSFIVDDCPKSIYCIDDAKKCAIEISSFSKSAGLTNLRCGYTVVPKLLTRQNQMLNKMWFIHQCTFFNGVPYHIQKGAEFALSKEGQKICQKNINYYRQNVKILKNKLAKLGFSFIGNTNSPYVWAKIPNQMTSWKYFDYLLNTYHVVCVPGCAFGENGEGYVRFSAFAKRSDILAF